MKKIVYVFLIVLSLCETVNAQNSLWSITPNHYDIQNTLLTPLPQPTVLPDGTPIIGADPYTYYHGEVSQNASNMITKPNGEIEFFIIDGFIYDKNGYAIDQLYTNETPNNLAKGASEILIVPNPANCNQYYIVSTVINGGMFEKIPYLFLLDMSAPSMLWTDLEYACDFSGALQAVDYTTGNPSYPINYISIDNISQGSFNPPNPGPGKRSGVFLASSKKRTDGSYKVFISNGDGLFTFTVDQTGFNFTNLFIFPDSGFNPSNVRGEMDIAELSNGNYRIAVPYQSSSFTGQNYFQNLYTAEITSSGTLASGTEKIFHTQYYNPGGVNQSAKYRGAEFSEDGRYLYVTHTVNVLDPNAFEYYDFNNPTTGLNPITLPSGLTQNDLQFSLIERGFNDVLYLANQNGLYQLADMTNPSSTISQVSSFTYAPNYEGQNPSTSSLKMYSLPDQIDGMDYASHFADNFQCCIDSRDFDVIDFTATANATWNATNPLNNGSTVATIKHELRIPAGKTITISGMTLKFAPGARLVIENGTAGSQGGKLLLVNSTLTVDDGCSSDMMWLGVEVWGNQNLSQGNIGNTSQGVLRILNGSIIEHAQIGVLVSQRNTSSPSGSSCYDELIFLPTSYNDARNGGIVQANQGSIFSNNQSGVFFRAHNSPSNVNNLSFFTKSTFKWENALLGNVAPGSHMILNQVKGINITGSDFLQNSPQLYTENTQGYGIFSGAAQFNVNSTCNSLIPLGGSCPPNDVNRSNFTGLTYGIYTLSSTAIFNGYTCNQSEFINCRYGIASLLTDNAKITLNNFQVREATYQTAGISLSSSKYFTIQENDFNEFTNSSIPTADIQSYGIRIDNAGTQDEEVYKNTFQNLRIGGMSERKNASTILPNNGSTGLNWVCNDFRSDIYEADLGINGVIDYHQGTVATSTAALAQSSSARNSFSLTTNTGTEHDIKMYNPMTHAYPNSQDISYVHLDHVNHIANDKDNFISITVAQYGGNPLAPFGNTCPSKINVIGKKPLIALFQLRIDSLGGIIENGNSEELLYQSYFRADENATYTNLMHASPYLSDQVLLNYLDNCTTSSKIKDIMVHNSPLTEEVLDAVKLSRLPTATKNVIRAAQTGISERSKVELALKENKESFTSTLNDLVNEIALDTTIVGNTDSLINLLEPIEAIEAKRILASVYMQASDFDKVELIIEEIESDEDTDYISMLRTQIALQEHPSYEAAVITDESLKEDLETLALSDNNFVAQSALNILSVISGVPREVEEFLPLDGPSGISIYSNEQTSEASNSEQKLIVHIYPNPSTGNVYFDLPDHEEGTMHIQLFDLTGKEAFNKTFLNSNGEIVDLSGVQKGTYIVRIVLGESYTESQLLQLKD